MGSLAKDLVLVVDDDPDLLDMIDLVLRLGNCQVRRAKTGRAALETLAAGHRPSLVLLDLMLPDMRGEEAYAAMRALPDPPPVVLMSAAMDVAARADRLGVPYLLKPFDVEGLMSLVRQRCPSATRL